MNKRPNQFGYLTEIQIDAQVKPVHSYGSSSAVGFVREPGLIRFEGIAPATPEMMQVVSRWVHSSRKLPFYQDEWMCLYCASPNPLPKTHCTQCGAPRSWLIG